MLDIFLNVDDKVVPYPVKKTFDEARLDPLIIMQKIQQSCHTKCKSSNQTATLRASICSLIANNSWLQGQLNNDTNFFEAGLDSLQLPQLIAQLKFIPRFLEPWL